MWKLTHKDENLRYRMRIHRAKGYMYAATIDPGETDGGKRSSHTVCWGRLDGNLAFTPYAKFLLLPEEERRRYIFPEGWNVEAAFNTGGKKEERPVHAGDDRNRLYGDGYLLDGIADSIGLRDDLVSAFGKERADEILSISYYSLCTRKSLSHMDKEAKVRWLPSDSMYPAEVTRLSQSMTEEERSSFYRLRKSRGGEGTEWYGVDSTSVSTYARSLADAKWGRNKEHDTLRQMNVVVMYDMRTELPAYCSRIPGNTPDSRTIRGLMEDIESFGFKDYGLILDRAYLNRENLSLLISRGCKGIFMARTNDKAVSAAIGEAMGDPDGIMESWRYLRDSRLYARDFEYPFHHKEAPGPGKGEKLPQRLCLFFDPELRGAELKQVSEDIEEMRDSIDYHLASTVRPDGDLLDLWADYYDVVLSEDGFVASYARNDRGISQLRKHCGFFAIVCCNLPSSDAGIDVIQRMYSKRDRQEKAFYYSKTWQGGRRFRTSTELSTEGRTFFQFVTLILDCELHRLYRNSSAELRRKYDSPWSILSDVQSIRLVERKGKAPRVTPFIGNQIDVFDEFGIAIPEGCRPKTGPRSKPPKDRKPARKHTRSLF